MTVLSLAQSARHRSGVLIGIVFVFIVGAAIYTASARGSGLGSVLRSARTSSQDAATSSAVRTAFFLSKQVSPFDVRVEADQGVVTLRGDVPSDQIRQVAAAIAQDTSGVKQVINNLAVNPGVERNPEISTIRDRVADLEIRTLVIDALSKNTEFRDKRIEVQVDGAKVTLSGVVETPSQRSLAEQMALGISGVRIVSNNLQLASGQTVPASQSQDEKLARSVEFELYSTKAIPLNSLQIHARDGIVTLTGTVRARAEKLLAEKVAASVDGVGRVVNNLSSPDEGSPN